MLFHAKFMHGMGYFSVLNFTFIGLLHRLEEQRKQNLTSFKFNILWWYHLAVLRQS